MTQLEIVRMVIDNPKLLSGLVDVSDPEEITKVGSFLNFRLKQLELGYSLKSISSESVRLQAQIMFSEGYPAEWWLSVRGIFEAEAATKRERQFFAIVDKEYIYAKEQLENKATQEP